MTTTTSSSSVHFKFCGLFEIAIQKSVEAESILKSLAPLQISNPTKQVMHLTLCKQVSDIPANSNFKASTYKGIPWALSWEKDNDGSDRIFFHSPTFHSFLVPRMVIAPYLKKKLSENNGFMCIGSAFQWKDIIFVLFGKPGSSKTSRLLDAIEKGAHYLGDNELYVLPDNTIGSVFDEIELRYPTAKSTFIWQRIPSTVKIKLSIYHFISLMTFRHICFNHSQSSTAFFETKPSVPATKKIFVELGEDYSKGETTVDNVISSFLEYENNYRSLFGNSFFNQSDLEHTLPVIKNFLSRTSLWRLPSQIAIQELLEISS